MTEQTPISQDTWRADGRTALLFFPVRVMSPVAGCAVEGVHAVTIDIRVLRPHHDMPVRSVPHLGCIEERFEERKDQKGPGTPVFSPTVASATHLLHAFRNSVPATIHWQIKRKMTSWDTSRVSSVHWGRTASAPGRTIPGRLARHPHLSDGAMRAEQKHHIGVMAMSPRRSPRIDDRDVTDKALA